MIIEMVTGLVLNGFSYVLTGVLLTPLTVATYADLRARHEPFTTSYLIRELDR